MFTTYRIGFAVTLRTQESALKKVLGGLPADDEEHPSSAAEDSEALGDAIARLRALLEANDGDASEAVRVLARAAAGTVAREKLHALEQSVSDFEFEKALEQLNAIAVVLEQGPVKPA